jgi:hypothetical protein
MKEIFYYCEISSMLSDNQYVAVMEIILLSAIVTAVFGTRIFNKALLNFSRVEVTLTCKENRL